MHQLDDTPCVAAEFFKKNFKFKFENNVIYENIIYENMHVHFVENGS